MRILIYCVGSLKEAYWREAEKEYLKRLSPYAKAEIIEVPDLPSKEGASKKSEEETKEKEGERILAKIKPSDYVVLLDLGGEETGSVELSRRLEGWMERGGASVTFVIGGSLGLSESLRKRGNDVLTLSKLTFTHQMSRIILLEQIYRAFRIMRGEPYHK
jgi:23S rRNA (pseudouridine1915-N3)-methyltransferase